MADIESVWDGEGPDPWAPQRAAYTAQLNAAELAVREQVWAELSGWLVEVSRAVLGSVRPDPVAVFSQDDEWRAAVDRIVRGTITDTITDAYDAIISGGERLTSRPMIVDHLAQVTNRMVRTPESVFDLVASEVAVGAELGESIPEIASRIDDVLDVTKTERWANRSTVVARTETLGALNAGRTEAFADVVVELGGGPFEQVWISTMDRRTRPTHKRADGQRVPMGTPFQVGGASLRYPCDPLGPGKETIMCRCSSILVEPDETVDLTNRQYKKH